VVSDTAEHASLDHAELLPWLGTQPEAAKIMLQLLARRLRATNAMVADLISIDVPGRLAKALLELARRFGVPEDTSGPGAVRVDHGLTQEELARLVGASRESVNKALADFVGRGWLQLGSRGVLSRSALASLDWATASASCHAALAPRTLPSALRTAPSARSASTRDLMSSAGVISASEAAARAPAT